MQACVCAFMRVRMHIQVHITLNCIRILLLQRIKRLCRINTLLNMYEAIHYIYVSYSIGGAVACQHRFNSAATFHFSRCNALCVCIELCLSFALPLWCGHCLLTESCCSTLGSLRSYRQAVPVPVHQSWNSIMQRRSFSFANPAIWNQFLVALGLMPRALEAMFYSIAYTVRFSRGWIGRAPEQIILEGRYMASRCLK